MIQAKRLLTHVLPIILTLTSVLAQSTPCKLDNLPVPSISKQNRGGFKWECRKKKCSLNCFDGLGNDWTYKAVVPTLLQCKQSYVDNKLKWDWIWVKEEKKYSKRLDCRKEVDLFEIEAEVQEKKEVINERGDDDEPDNEPTLIEVKPMAITTTGLGERPGPGSMSTGPSSMTTMFSSIVPVPAVDLEFSSSSKPTSKPKKNKNRGYGEEEIFNLSSFLGDFAGNDDYYEDEGSENDGSYNRVYSTVTKSSLYQIPMEEAFAGTTAKNLVPSYNKKDYVYELENRQDVYLDEIEHIIEYDQDTMLQMEEFTNSSAEAIVKKGCRLMDIPPLPLVREPQWFCRKNRCSLYCVDNEAIYRKFKGLYVCLGNNKWKLKKGISQKALETEITCEKPKCEYDTLPFYENTRWYCNVGINECWMFCENGAQIDVTARCKIKNFRWIVQGGPVRCVHKGWCDERLLPEVKKGTWTVGKGNRAASLHCEGADAPQKGAAKCDKKTSQWTFPSVNKNRQPLKCNCLCKEKDLKPYEKGWWVISNKKSGTADFHCLEGVTRKAARCNFDTGKWVYRENLRCYSMCDEEDLVSQGIGKWVVHQTSKGQMNSKLYCDGEVTKDAATCDTDKGLWSYKKGLSCCSVQAQLLVMHGMWERYSYNRYRLFCNGVAQDLIYICENNMWVTYPKLNRDSTYLYCQSERAINRPIGLEFKSEAELRMAYE